mmetsp:Transcript_14910/g.58446  ORF Transcript_14910/g.58446 Transcript_14910/m.58446 type:complete len:229 (-) Transcript_14910:665-1351(-)
MATGPTGRRCLRARAGSCGRRCRSWGVSGAASRRWTRTRASRSTGRTPADACDRSSRTWIHAIHLDSRDFVVGPPRARGDAYVIIAAKTLNETLKSRHSAPKLFSSVAADLAHGVDEHRRQRARILRRGSRPARQVDHQAPVPDPRDPPTQRRVRLVRQRRGRHRVNDPRRELVKHRRRRLRRDVSRRAPRAPRGQHQVASRRRHLRNRGGDARLIVGNDAAPRGGRI